MGNEKIRTEHILSSDRTGDGDQLVTANTGAKTTGNLASFDASDDLQDSGVASSSVGKVSVAKAGTLIGTRGRINLIEGSNVTLTVTDDSGNDEVDVSVASSGGSGGGRVLLASSTASNSASIDFDTVFTSTYDIYEIELIRIVPVSDDAELKARLRSGGSYQSTNYSARMYGTRSDSILDRDRQGNSLLTTDQTQFHVLGCASSIFLGLSNSAGASADGIMSVWSPSSTSVHKGILARGVGVLPSGHSLEWRANGVWHSTSAATGIQFFMNSGNISSGVFRVWGIPTS